MPVHPGLPQVCHMPVVPICTFLVKETQSGVNFLAQGENSRIAGKAKDE